MQEELSEKLWERFLVFSVIFVGIFFLIFLGVFFYRCVITQTNAREGWTTSDSLIKEKRSVSEKTGEEA